MDTGLIEVGSRPGWWIGAVVMALFAAGVALELCRGILSTQRATSARSLSAAALALTSGAWAVHFMLVSATELLTAWHYSPWAVYGLWAFGWLTAAGGLRWMVTRTPTPAQSLAGASLLATGLVLTPVLAALALRVDPAVSWHLHPSWGFVGLSWAACWAASLLMTRGLRRHQPHSGAWRCAAAACAALATVLANLTLAGTARVPALAVTASGVSAETLLALGTLAVPSLLALLLLSAVLESRFKAALRRAREELRLSVQTDALTQLPNRAMFESWLMREATKADRAGHRLALLYVNLDGLQTINESFGQASGDAVLCEVARRLRGMVATRDLAARAGGDEFLLLLEGNPSESDAAHLAHRLLKVLNDPCMIDDREVSTSCSVGIAMYPEHGAHTKLIAHAGAAMHSAKRNGGATYCFFEPRMVAGARDQIDLLRDLRRAIHQNELELYYQPKIHAPSGQITGAEALMRWHHPQRGMIGPNVFIPLAEKFGLIQPMGNWLIEEVCRQIGVWRDGGLRMRVSINLSVHQLRQDDLVPRITEALASHQIPASLLTCEITESAAMEDTRTTLKVIERLSAAGVHLSIDDFGTGYSSLSYLRQLAAEELKIDRSFVLDLETSADARAIVDAVVKLAQALGLKVVAEGVETEAQQKILRSLGCDELQGFLFAKPMSAKALTMWATQDDGPRPLDFRPSLFDDTLSRAVL